MVCCSLFFCGCNYFFQKTVVMLHQEQIPFIPLVGCADGPQPPITSFLD
jgi:hypothetical protein